MYVNTKTPLIEIVGFNPQKGTVNTIIKDSQDSIMLSPNIENVSISEEIIEAVLRRLSAKPVIEHVCHNCGGHLTMDEANHLFICPYCKTAYLIGTNQIYSR